MLRVGLLDDVTISIVQRENMIKAIERAAPDFVPLMIAAGGTAIPYVGLAVVVVTIALKHSKPPTWADQQRMWDQAQGIY